MQIKTIIVSCHTADSKPVKQEVNSKAILLPLVFPGWINSWTNLSFVQLGLNEVDTEPVQFNTYLLTNETQFIQRLLDAGLNQTGLIKEEGQSEC